MPYRTFLKFWVGAETAASQNGRVLAKGGCLPPLRNIIQWSGAVIDAHLIAFSSDQDAAQVVIQAKVSSGMDRTAMWRLSHALRCLLSAILGKPFSNKYKSAAAVSPQMTGWLSCADGPGNAEGCGCPHEHHPQLEPTAGNGKPHPQGRAPTPAVEC